LYRREAFREAFADFDIDRVAAFSDRRVAELLGNSALIRNRCKIEASIHNAACAQKLRDEWGSLGAFFWSFEPAVFDRPDRVTSVWLTQNPVTPAPTALAAALKSRGWRFVGPTTMYALMQACGLVNDHIHGCHVREAVDLARDNFTRPKR
jgi:DNA-3-methyladenine glycosylase I